MRRVIQLVMIVALLTTAAPALADEAVRDAPVRDTTPETVVDEPASDVADDDSDAEVDRPIDRCRVSDVVTDRCHHVDRPDDINYRALIIRLIKAHEWQKLLRLLHFLGVI